MLILDAWLRAPSASPGRSGGWHPAPRLYRPYKLAGLADLENSDEDAHSRCQRGQAAKRA